MWTAFDNLPLIYLEGTFMQMKILIVLIVLACGVLALMFTKNPDSPAVEVVEEVIDYEIGAPQGTIDISRDFKPK